jgi:hypothetical protein
MGFIKLIIGLTLIALPISLYVYDFISTENLPYGIEPIKSLLTIIIASIPPVLALIGLFILWIGFDEWGSKSQQEDEEKDKEYKKIKDIVKGEYEED